MSHDLFPCMADKIPEASIGLARISHFTITEAQASMTALRALITGRSSEMVNPGRYAKLTVGGHVMMSDTDMERRTNSPLIRHAKEHVLVGGLGLGMIVFGLLAKKPKIHSLLVLEKNPDVINLIRPHLPKSTRLTIVHADAFDWEWHVRGPKFSTIYFDIWPSIHDRNVSEARRLRDRFACWLVPGGWMGDWDTEYRRLGGIACSRLRP